MNIKELWLQSVDSWAKQEAMEKSIPEFFAALIAAHEREECAKIAEIAEPYQAADLIRARSNT